METAGDLNKARFFFFQRWSAYAVLLACLQKTVPAPTWRQPIVTSLILDATLLAELGFGLSVIARIGRKRAIDRLLKSAMNGQLSR